GVAGTGVTAGQRFYGKVAGAATTSFGTGAYALTLNLGTGAAPAVPLPVTTLPNGNPIHSGGSMGLVQSTGTVGEGGEVEGVEVLGPVATEAASLAVQPSGVATFQTPA